MLTKWVEEYKKLSEKLRFLSKLAMFLVAIFSLLSLYDIANVFNRNPEYIEKFSNFDGLLAALMFQTTIVAVFSLRFAVLFFKSNKIFYYSQILWIVGLALLAVYFYISRPVPGPFIIYSTYGDGIFNYASRFFDSFGLWYLLLSLPLKLLTLLIALIKSR